MAFIAFMAFMAFMAFTFIPVDFFIAIALAAVLLVAGAAYMAFMGGFLTFPLAEPTEADEAFRPMEADEPFRPMEADDPLRPMEAEEACRPTEPDEPRRPRRPSVNVRRM